MSEKRTLLSRPRTRVYDCNYNIGEKYYKPMVDQLDRKYSAPFLGSSSLSGTGSRLREDDDFWRPSRMSPFTSDFDKPTEPIRRLNGETRSLEDDLEDEIANSMRKLKVLRAAKAASVEEESNCHSDFLNGIPKHKRLNLADKILDSVGVNGKMQDSLEDEILKKRTVKLSSAFDDEPSSFTKWTALREPSFRSSDEFSAAKTTAANRARQSRARIADIENEIDAITQKNISRDKRLSNLKSLIAGEDPLLFDDNVDTYKSSKKVASSSVKKVTF